MKSIGYISANFFPEDKAASVRAGFFVDKLIEEKHNVVIFTSVKNDDYDIIKNRSSLPTNKDRNIVRLVRELLYGVELFFRIISYKRMDIYIISSPPFFITFFAFLAVKIKNSKNIILDVRDIYPEVFFENKLIKRESFLASILIKIEYYLYNNSKSIISVTEGIKSLIVSENHIYDKVVVVKNGFDKNIFKVRSEKFENFTMVFHGTLGRFQNIEILMDVIKYFNKFDSKVKFLVLGEGNKDFMLKSNNLSNLEYIENMPYKEISKIIAKCHLGLSFRTDDNISKISLPVKIFEYIGVGIPMVVTPVSEAGEMVQKSNIGLQCDNHVEDIINNIKSIRTNYTTYLKALKANRNQFSRQYEVEKFYGVVKNC